MKDLTRNILALPGVLFVIIVTCYVWYFAVLRPQRKTATLFLEALKTRNVELLKETTAPEEFAVYKNLYLKNGFNKHLLSYEGLEERDADGHFFPTRTRFSTEVKEDDTFFGIREHTYFLSVEKREDKWWVIQFSCYQDQDDLKKLKKFKPQKEGDKTP